MTTENFIKWMSRLGKVPYVYVLKSSDIQILKRQNRWPLSQQREAEQNGYERNRIVRLEYAAPWKKARALQEVKSRRAWKRDRGMATLPLPC